MMIFSIYDSVSDTLGNTLYTFPNEGVARRAFKAAVQKGVAQLLGSVLDAPEDFYLVKVGQLDQEKGNIIACPSERVFRFSELEDVKNV